MKTFTKSGSRCAPRVALKKLAETDNNQPPRQEQGNFSTLKFLMPVPYIIMFESYWNKIHREMQACFEYEAAHLSLSRDEFGKCPSPNIRVRQEDKLDAER